MDNHDLPSDDEDGVNIMPAAPKEIKANGLISASHGPEGYP